MLIITLGDKGSRRIKPLSIRQTANNLRTYPSGKRGYQKLKNWFQNRKRDDCLLAVQTGIFEIANVNHDLESKPEKP